MKYRYLYQDRENRNHEGEIDARSREDAYARLRKQGIRPYRVIGDDPVNWKPWAIASGYALLLAALVVAVIFAVSAHSERKPKYSLSREEAQAFRLRAAEAVDRAPEAYRYNVWKGVNVRLEERGLAPLPRPDGLEDEPEE